MNYDDPDQVPAIWEVGDVILDLYEVKEVYTGGGMGLVYRVHHRNWNLDLAVKSPRPEYFQSQKQVENFEREAETWVNLGLHPHTVSCYYVRRLGGIPRIFAEYVDGGSLADWIRSRRLYEDGPGKALERILDIAIQIALGLRYAHLEGIIHQDVKPGNVLIGLDGYVQVTDFGLAKAQSVSGGVTTPNLGQGMLVTYGGMTPAYCSPEQAEIAALSLSGTGSEELTKLTKQTDIWSWAVSVFEMFVGERPCPMGGQAASEAFETYLDIECDDQELPTMPEGMADILRRCFLRDPRERPQHFGDVARLVENQYWVIHDKYPPHTPEKAVALEGTLDVVEELTDTLNNRALSLMDLGKKQEAETLLDGLIQNHPEHPEAIYNRGIIHWRSKRQTDDKLLSNLEVLRKSKPNDWKPAYAIGLVHLERTDKEGAIQELEAAKELGGPSEVSSALVKAHAMTTSESSNPLRTFKGHQGKLHSVCISSDNRWALSGSSDHTLRLWEVETGRLLRIFEGHKDKVLSVCLSSDNQWALSTDVEGTLRQWKVATGECVRILEGHALVCLSSDSRWALSDGWTEYGDDILRLWDLASGKRLNSFLVHTRGEIHSLILSLDNKQALVSQDTTASLWDLATGECLRTFIGHTGEVRGACLSAVHPWAISGSDDGTIRLWDVDTGQCLRVFKGHDGAVNALCLSQDNRLVLSGGDDNTLRIWDVTTGQCLRTFEGHTNRVYSVALSPDGQMALSGSGDNTLRLWNICGLTHTGQRKQVPFLLCRMVSASGAGDAKLRFDRSICDASSGISNERWSEALKNVTEARSIRGYEADAQALKLWNDAGLHGFRRSFRAGWLLRTFVDQHQAVTCVRLSSDNAWALSGSGNNALCLWDTMLRKDSIWGRSLAWGLWRRSFEGHKEKVHSVCLSADDQLAISASHDKTIRLWEISTGECLRIFEIGASSCIASSTDLRWVFSGGSSHEIKMWDTNTGNCLRNLQGHSNSVSSIYLSADNCKILTGSWDNEGGLFDRLCMGAAKEDDKALRLWDVTTGKCLHTFVGHNASVGAVCLSSDNRWAISGSGDSRKHDDCTLRLWNLSTGQCERVFEGHLAKVNSVNLTADARWAVSGSDDKTVRLWNIATGQCERIFEGHRGKVLSVSFSADSRFIVSGNDDITFHLWELDWDFETSSPVDWDEGARFVLANFLTLHTPFAAELPTDRQPTDDEITHALTRSGAPAWNDGDFKQLLATLACSGYGWLRPEGVRRELVTMASTWKGIPPA